MNETSAADGGLDFPNFTSDSDANSQQILDDIVRPREIACGDYTPETPLDPVAGTGETPDFSMQAVLEWLGSIEKCGASTDINIDGGAFTDDDVVTVEIDGIGPDGRIRMQFRLHGTDMYAYDEKGPSEGGDATRRRNFQISIVAGRDESVVMLRQTRSHYDAFDIALHHFAKIVAANIDCLGSDGG